MVQLGPHDKHVNTFLPAMSIYITNFMELCTYIPASPKFNLIFSSINNSSVHFISVAHLIASGQNERWYWAQEITNWAEIPGARYSDN